MLSFTSYTKAGCGWRRSFGGFCAAASFVIGIIYLVMKLLYWDRFAAGMGAASSRRVLPGISTDLFHWPSGEYIMSINTRVMHRPLVIEEERINFGGGQDGEAGSEE